MILYLIGSMKNPQIPEIANRIREATGFEVFDDWHCVGPEADDYWKDYELRRGHSYAKALQGWHAKNVFNFDKYHLDRADATVLVLPAGRSAHLELGYMIGCGKPGFILLDGADCRFDVMYQFATGVASTEAELLTMLKEMRHGS